MPLICVKLPFSKYFQLFVWKSDHRDLLEQVMHKNRVYSKFAQMYFADLNKKKSLDYYHQLGKETDIDIAVAVVTVKRKSWKSNPLFNLSDHYMRSLNLESLFTDQDLGYLTQTMASLDSALKDDKSKLKKAMFICNTDLDPDGYKEAQDMGQYIPVVQRYQGKAKGQKPWSVDYSFDLEKQDYVFCLREALKMDPKHILLIQDDAVAIPHFFPVLQRILTKQDWLNRNSIAYKKLGYTKLFYPKRWQGYAFEGSRVFELIGVLCLGGGISVLLFCFQWGRRHDLLVHSMVFTVGGVYLLLLAYFIGRPHILELTHKFVESYSVLPAPDCCYPAVLYPSHVVPELVYYLDKLTCSMDNRLDSIFEDHLRKKGLDLFLVEPNLVKHIGMYSSIKIPTSKYITAEFLEL